MLSREGRGVPPGLPAHTKSRLEGWHLLEPERMDACNAENVKLDAWNAEDLPACACLCNAGKVRACLFVQELVYINQSRYDKNWVPWEVRGSTSAAGGALSNCYWPPLSCRSQPDCHYAPPPAGHHSDDVHQLPLLRTAHRPGLGDVRPAAASGGRCRHLARALPGAGVPGQGRVDQVGGGGGGYNGEGGEAGRGRVDQVGGIALSDVEC